MAVAPSPQVLHPAKFGDKLIEAMSKMLAPYGHLRILDPFAGTGRIHELQAFGHHTTGVEIVAQYADLHPDTIHGNSLYLRDAVRSRQFTAIATSPTYGNRFSDHHNNRDVCKRCKGTGEEPKDHRICKTCRGTRLSMRRSYTHDLRRMVGDPTLHLDQDNSGKMAWGPKYRNFHERVWIQVPPLLTGHRLFLLNCKDHFKKRAVQPVTDWHVETLESIGFEVLRREECDTGSLRHGAHYQDRCPEQLILLQLR